jgi:TetR/AcrR family transcriptional regulator, transcriptional repressor of aconitase
MPKVPKGYIEARRKEIVDAAMTCFLRKGFHQTTMQDICKESELSPGAVYRYFTGKSEIMRAVIDRNTEQWSQLIDLAGQMAPEPGQTLDLVGQYFFNRFHDPEFEQNARVDIETWPEALRDPELRATNLRQIRTLRKHLADLVRPRMEAFPGIEPETLVNMYMAVYQGLLLNKVIDPEGVDTDAVMEALRLIQIEEAPAQQREGPTSEPLPLREPRAGKEA